MLGLVAPAREERAVWRSDEEAGGSSGKIGVRASSDGVGKLVF
jgi:hypothetical protein